MIFKSLYLKNIRSYREATLTLSEGAVLLAGDVGAGKSTILLAIEYALFGLQPGQRGSALLRNGENEGAVALTCTVGAKTFMIERSLKRDARGVSNEYAALTLEGKKEECSITELKTKILALLGYPEEFIKKNNILYKYTIYTPQEQMKQIITEDPETRLSILRHIFGINKYRRIRENLALVLAFCKDEIKTLQIEITLLEHQAVKKEEKQKAIVLLTTKKEALEVSLAVKRKQHAELENALKEIELKQKERAVFEKEIEKAQLLLTTKKEALQNALKEQNRIKLSIKESIPFDAQGYELLIKQLVGSKTLEEILSAKVLSCKAECASLETQKKAQSEKKEKVFKLNHCPTCLQNVPLAHRHNIAHELETTLSSYQKQLARLEMVKKEVEEAYEKQKAITRKYELEKQKADTARTKEVYLAESRAKEVEVTKTIEGLTKDTLFLGEHLVQLREAVASFTKFGTLMPKKEQEVRIALREEREAELALGACSKEITFIERELVTIEELIHQRKEKEHLLLHKSTLLDWLMGPFTLLVESTERQVLLNIRREFSQLLQQWFYSIAGEGFTLELDEHFTPIILHKGLEMEYAFLSGGERTALALAYRLALTTVINSFISTINTRDIVILDEPTDGFSDYQIDKMREVLKGVACKQLILVSHEQKMEGFVDTIIKIEKKGDESHIISPSPNQPQILNTLSSHA
jgi:DNA repair protein SbcC/Rad50